jgi:hypothetical protein
MAGSDFGGRMSVRLSSGSTISFRGTFNVMPARQSVEAITNQDGSTDRVGTPVSPGAELTFKDSGDNLAAIMEAPRQNIVVSEEFTGVQHHFISAFFSGQPSVNRNNGEVSGLSIVAETYRKTGG